jgi:hypothetical protein
MLKGTMTQKILKPKTKQTAILRPVEDIVVEVFGNYPDGEYDPYDPDSWDEFDEGQEIKVNILGTFKETKPYKGTHTVLQCELRNSKRFQYVSCQKTRKTAKKCNTLIHNWLQLFVTFLTFS